MAGSGLQSKEEAALDQAEDLIKFACENSKDLSGEVVKSIAECRAAIVSNYWDADTSEKFWIAFNKLCFFLSNL